MIVKMSKVEIVGPKELLQRALALVRDEGIFQIEPSAIGFVEKDHEAHIRSFVPDEKTALERIFLADLYAKIVELFSYLPETSRRESYIEPQSIIHMIARIIPRHIVYIKERHDVKETLRTELVQLERYRVFHRTLASLLEKAGEAPDLDFIGLTIREPGMLDKLRDAISRATDWRFELLSKSAEDGTLVGLITVERQMSDRVKKALTAEQVPELTFPPSFSNLTFQEKTAYVEKRISEITEKIKTIDTDMGCFSLRWAPIYDSVRKWIEERLSLLNTTAAAFETRMCFFINGWMPSRDVGRLRQKTAEAFGNNVVVLEKEIREEDLDRVPISLSNPAYFRPFELFSRLLPLPKYTSYDPTPFIGIFFPIFFGMILGDAGYGLTLLIVSSIIRRRFSKRPLLRDAGSILFISSLYAIVFGLLYAEFFGELPHILFGIEPIWVERRTALVPMFVFAVAVGAAHILIGLVLGAVNAISLRKKREAAYRIISILIIIGMITVAASLAGLFPAILTGPVIIALLLLVPFLIFTGGILAPIEFLKAMGNIISYARIMAIGLTSVLLAFVANRLAGLAGDIVAGIAIAALLHLLNIILGVFSPTIHSLRLHYVEFFSKFIEHGGRRFEPLKRQTR